MNLVSEITLQKAFWAAKPELSMVELSILVQTAKFKLLTSTLSVEEMVEALLK
jgi:hypothetical protein